MGEVLQPLLFSLKIYRSFYSVLGSVEQNRCCLCLTELRFCWGDNQMHVLTMVISAVKERFMVPRKRIIGGIVNKFNFQLN